MAIYAIVSYIVFVCRILKTSSLETWCRPA